MGILPLQFADGESVASLGLTGLEEYTVAIFDAMTAQQEVAVTATADDGKMISFRTISRIDTPIEIGYYRDGGILRTVLKKLLAAASGEHPE